MEKLISRNPIPDRCGENFGKPERRTENRFAGGVLTITASRRLWHDYRQFLNVRLPPKADSASSSSRTRRRIPEPWAPISLPTQSGVELSAAITSVLPRQKCPLGPGHGAI